MDDDNIIDITKMKLVLDTSEAEEAINKVKAKLFELADVLEKANSLRDELASGEIDLNLSFDVQSDTPPITVVSQALWSTIDGSDNRE